MNTEIKIGDYIRGAAPHYPDHFGRVIGFKTEKDVRFIIVDIPYSLIFINFPDKMAFCPSEYTKITAQKYFKHLLSKD